MRNVPVAASESGRQLLDGLGLGLGLALLAALAACGTTTRAPGGNSAGACADNPPGCACTSDVLCGAPNPRCDGATGRCVPCLPGGSECTAPMRCVGAPGQYKCSAGETCTVDADCASPGLKRLCCSGSCVDSGSDAANCGACGKGCGSATNATVGCAAGTCAISACNAGFGDCDKKLANGCEVDITKDADHCGSCDTPCRRAPNTMVTCAASTCTSVCTADFGDCDNNPMNGCESSLQTNPDSCGACGMKCANLPNAMTASCFKGACAVGSCKAPFTDCNHLAADGCEANLDSDPNNCLFCGKKCDAIANGTPGCNGGSCGVGKCNANFADCDGNVLNGCEENLTANPKNCGACGKVCSAPNAVMDCQGGGCVLVSCAKGFADCDNNPANGCEVLTNVDLKNCGGCGVACPVPQNATASCSNGVCSIGSCLYGFGDCNKNLNDGCETNLLQVSNCGACGAMCAQPANGVGACPNAVCAIGMCNPGFADCDMKVGNGCEVTLASDGNHCGACGVACQPAKNQAGACVAGKCGLGACLAGFADCNNNLADGCEVNTNADDKNCAGCGKVCPNGTTCSNGVCQACGVDCWGPTGCLTAGGRCIWFTCRAGNAGETMCNGCKGWKDVTYDQWMNQGYCADVIARYRQSDGTATHCGQAASCCGSSQACAGGDNAWHFYNPLDKNNYYTGPSLGTPNDVNCKYWNNVDNGSYTRITICTK